MFGKADTPLGRSLLEFARGIDKPVGTGLAQLPAPAR